jgi:NTE family protein
MARETSPVAFVLSGGAGLGAIDELAAIWRDERRSQICPLRPFSGLLADLSIPLHVVAVDVVTGEERLLSAGSLLDAVIASAAIPAVLPPVQCARRVVRSRWRCTW